MTSSLRVFLIIGTILFTAIIVYLLRKKQMNIKYILLWLSTALVMLVVAIFPEILYGFSGLIGVEVPVNTVFMIIGMLTLVILLSITLIVSHLALQNRKLTQTIALLEERLRRLEKK